ncbi:unnamed protein product [Schistosoma bovis]|uniref:RILP-like protein 1 n=1 Tax=Schistosoma bovis TaxID=6184 RepID=A0A430Q1Q2_SCHBO|nr:RILP-like protein 1 [Schistosoma bovis]CAH8482160.1 unnamed protein product [Schistosoma bovis]
MFTTMDVYDAALSIGRECQLIVDEYGDDVLRDLMPKIVYILEELEACTSYCDKEKEEIARLQTVADELRQDQKSDIILKDKYDKSLEQLEQSWYCESQKLLQEIAELEQENVRLTHHLISSCHKEVREQEDSNILQNCVMCDESNIICPTSHQSKVGAFLLATAKLGLKGVSANLDTDKIYDNLKIKPSEEELSDMMSSLLLETEERIQLTEQENRAADLQLVQQLKECVAINYKTARQIRRELTEVGASLDASEEEVCRLARQSGQLLASCAPHRRQTGQLVSEKATLETQLCIKERELANLLKDLSNNDTLHNNQSGIMSNTCESILQLPAGQGLESINFEQESNTTNKYISVEELRYLLHERNELKCRLIELEEELRLLELENQKDPEVEGPMLPEPPEKLRPNRTNRLTIKMIFENLLHHLTERATTILS